MAAAESTGEAEDADFSSAFKVARVCSGPSAQHGKRSGSGMDEGRAGVRCISQGRSSECSLTSKLQRLSADGDALPCAVSRSLIHLTPDASVHA